MQIISNAMTLNLLGGKFQICTETRMFDWNHPSSRLSTTTESVMIILFLFSKKQNMFLVIILKTLLKRDKKNTTKFMGLGMLALVRLGLVFSIL
jgi:hypothetical protein